MLDTRVSNECCACYMTSSGGQAWPCRCRRSISSYEQYIQHEGSHTKAIMQLIILPHLWSCCMLTFTSIETMMELDGPPIMVNLLVFCNHFMKHIMAYVTPDKTAKTVAKFLWQWNISIFGSTSQAPERLRANFESNIIRQFCKLMGIQNIMTLPYHVQTIGQVESAHQMLMCMIGKLSKDQQALRWYLSRGNFSFSTRIGQSICLSWCMFTTVWDWPSSGTALHYLMFRHWPYLPINFYFPMIRGTKRHQCVDHYLAKLCERLWEAFKEAQVQSTSEVERQKW